jgi:hypothetical protein
MKSKSSVKAALLVFVFGSLAFLAVKESRQRTAPGRVAARGQELGSSSVQPLQTVSAPKAQAAKVIAYYFHTTYRCATCRRIETYSRVAIETAFAQELQDGRLEFRLVNCELPANQHYVQEYNLFTKSLVLVRMKEGKQIEWTNLSHVWDYVRDMPTFLAYVQGEVRKYLEKS